MPFGPAVTERAARILAERAPAPRDRLDAFLFLAGQDFLWRRDGPGADFGEAIRVYEVGTGKVVPRVASLPVFGAVKHRRAERRREVAVRLAGYFLDWIFSRERGRVSDRIWHLGDGLTIGLGLSHAEHMTEPPRSLADAERRVTELALANIVDASAGRTAA